MPTNPNTGGPLLFVPKRFLRELPVLNAYDWWDDYENEQLREDVNYEIMGRVDKDTIVSVARQQPELVRQWIQRRENDPAESYDFERDPQGVWRWQAATQEFAERNELRISPPQTLEEFFGVITRIIDAYRLFVEEQGGWQLLWDKDDEKPESAAQLLFRGIAQHYAKANNVVLDPEVNLGRGPVDFKFSNGYTRRLHLEVKKLHNGKFWNGLERQLPSYMKSDDLQHGWLLALQYRSAGTSNARRKELPARTKKLSEETDLNIRFALVDARPKDSASRL